MYLTELSELEPEPGHMLSLERARCKTNLHQSMMRQRIYSPVFVFSVYRMKQDHQMTIREGLSPLLLFGDISIWIIREECIARLCHWHC